MTDEPKLWYHWSPTERRASIEHDGLMPGKLSRDFFWRPPYVCLASSPMRGWYLSGGMPGGRQIASWDLWEVDVSEQKGYEALYYDNSRIIKEIRVYERIFKRNVTLVGQRHQKARISVSKN